MAGKLFLSKAIMLILVSASARAATNCLKNAEDACPEGQFCAAPGNSQNPSQPKCYDCSCSIVPDQCRLAAKNVVTCDCTGSGYTGDYCTVDVDECASSSLNNCDENAQCTNTDGSFTCACNTGYTGDGVSCTVLNATCENTDGSFTCTCNTGYTGDGFPGNCANIDECVTLNPACAAGYDCEDKIPGYCCNPTPP